MAKVTIHTGFETPPAPLSRAGRKACRIIREFCARHELDAGHDKAFYSPAEWRERGEAYGNDAELVVLHECGSAKIALSLDGAYDEGLSYDLYEKLNEELRDAGLYLEGLFRWCSAVYKI